MDLVEVAGTQDPRPFGVNGKIVTMIIDGMTRMQMLDTYLKTKSSSVQRVQIMQVMQVQEIHHPDEPKENSRLK